MAGALLVAAVTVGYGLRDRDEQVLAAAMLRRMGLGSGAYQASQAIELLVLLSVSWAIGVGTATGLGRVLIPLLDPAPAIAPGIAPVVPPTVVAGAAAAAAGIAAAATAAAAFGRRRVSAAEVLRVAE